MTTRRLGALSGAVLALAGMYVAAATAPAAAQSGGYAEEYQKYNEALARADTAAATAHALAAWRAAEETLGDHKTTAVLAYNYGQYVLFDDPASALPALERTNALVEAGIADLPAADLDAYIAYAAFKNNGEKSRDAKAVAAALEAREASGAGPSYEAAGIWLRLALYQLNTRKYDDARESAQKSDAYMTAVLPEAYSMRGQAMLVSGASYLLPWRRTPEEITMGHEIFVNGVKMFPEQRDLENFNPVLAQLVAWDYAAHAVLHSEPDLSKEERQAAMENWSSYDLLFEGEPEGDECTARWAEQDPPTYPRSAARKGYIGAAVIGYHVAEDGTPEGARILAEVPDTLFGEFALKAMEDWRRELPLPANPACRKNQLLSFSFVMTEDGARDTGSRIKK